MKKQIFIIEHLEKEIFPWCLIEYKHISETVGKENLWFTNLKDIKGKESLEGLGKLMDDSVKNMNLQGSCVLDPNTEETLTPENCEEIDYFVFGGILGDHPPKARTKDELTKFLKNPKVFNIGKEQMSTDNAVLVVKEISEGKNLGDLKFQDGIEVKIDEIASLQLPYRYRIINGKPFISQELIEYHKNKEGF